MTPLLGERGVGGSARVLLVLLAAALPGILVLPFVPVERFIERYDDTFYYFQVAVQYSRTGRWTFDGVEPTNGVQPLWAAMLSVVSVVAHAAGFTDKLILARAFVLLACVLHVGSAALLFVLIRRVVSPLAGIAATGALLCSPGLVWARAAGMESSLYAVLLLTAILVLQEPGWRARTPTGWLGVGILLGLTTLSRLNAALLLPWVVWRVWRAVPPGRRSKAVLSLTAGWGLLLVPYVSWNLASTGLLLPISGAAKQIEQVEVIRRAANGSRLRYVARQAPRLHAPVASRAADGLWLLGSRVRFGDSVVSLRRKVGPALGGLALLAFARGAGGLIFRGLARLGALGFVAGFAATNTAVSLVMYPAQVEYAMAGWWLVELDLVVSTSVAVLVALSLEGAWGDALRAWRVRVAMAWVTLLAVAGSAQAIPYHMAAVPARQFDWNATDNAGRLAAARWLKAHTQPGDLVGAWNAGVVAYFSDRSVVNLDGLVNSPAYLTTLRQGGIPQYVLARKIRYLADSDPLFDSLHGCLGLTERWRWYSALLRAHHHVYAVEPVSRETRPRLLGCQVEAASPGPDGGPAPTP